MWSCAENIISITRQYIHVVDDRRLVKLNKLIFWKALRFNSQHTTLEVVIVDNFFFWFIHVLTMRSFRNPNKDQWLVNWSKCTTYYSLRQRSLLTCPYFKYRCWRGTVSPLPTGLALWCVLFCFIYSKTRLRWVGFALVDSVVSKTV